MTALEPRKAQLILMALHLTAKNDGPHRSWDRVVRTAKDYVGRNYGVTPREVDSVRRMTVEDLVLLALQAGPPEETRHGR